MDIKPGDKVTHSAYPNLEFEVVSTISLGRTYNVHVRCTNKSLWLTFWAPATEFKLVDPFGFDLIPIGSEKDKDQKTSKICYPHVEGSTPVSLGDKNLEVWYICKNCGVALRPFKEPETLEIVFEKS
jgi:hypothetical protein